MRTYHQTKNCTIEADCRGICKASSRPLLHTAYERLYQRSWWDPQGLRLRGTAQRHAEHAPRGLATDAAGGLWRCTSAPWIGRLSLWFAPRIPSRTKASVSMETCAALPWRCTTSTIARCSTPPAATLLPAPTADQDNAEQGNAEQVPAARCVSLWAFCCVSNSRHGPTVAVVLCLAVPPKSRHCASEETCPALPSPLRRQSFKTWGDARDDLIDVLPWCHRSRLHSTLAWIGPINCRNNQLANQPRHTVRHATRSMESRSKVNLAERAGFEPAGGC